MFVEYKPRQCAIAAGRELPTYRDLHAWSVDDLGRFWAEVWDACGVVGSRGEGPPVSDPHLMPGARFFPTARLNFAENLLGRPDEREAIVLSGEGRVRQTLTRAALHDDVSRLAQALRDAGVGPGDRVAAYLPNLPAAVIGMLATATLGAIWSSCSPDFGVRGVLDRFGQISPKVLLGADGYFYGGKAHDCLSRLGPILAGLPSVERTIVVPYVAESPDIRVLFEDTGEVGQDNETALMLGILFDGAGQCAFIQLNPVGGMTVEFGKNSWRGDRYEYLLRNAMETSQSIGSIRLGPFAIPTT